MATPPQNEIYRAFGHLEGHMESLVRGIYELKHSIEQLNQRVLLLERHYTLWQSRFGALLTTLALFSAVVDCILRCLLK